MRIPLAFLLLLLGPGPGPAQEPPTFATGVELVQIEVRVTGDDGSPVTDLTLEDFAVEEDGQPQQIERVDYVAGPAGETAFLVPGEAPAAAPVEASPPPQPTWLYVAPEVRSAVEFTRVAGPLRRFLAELPEGFRVSLGGLPFTDRRDLLLATLDRMVDEPLGGEMGKAVVDPTLDLMDDLVFEREVLAAMGGDPGSESFVGMQADKTSAASRDSRDIGSLVSVATIDRQIIFYGKIALLRYLDLIERMAVLPGKKMILLYRSGLRIEADHSDLMEQMAAAALRHRVSVFTLDSRGLEAAAPVEDRRPQFAFEQGRRGMEGLGLPAARKQDVSGLLTLARNTGGQAVVDSNDMAAVLHRVVEEASGYYVLGYAPRDPEERGRFRKLKVSVSRPDTEVRSPRGYYESKPYDRLSDEERSTALYRALLSESPSDFPVEASASFFAAPEGRTAMLFSVGARPGDLAAKKGRKPELEATVLLQVRNRVLETMPLVLEQELRPEMDRQTLDRANDDPTVLLTWNGRVDLPPGRYALKVLFRDDRSGRLGSVTMNADAARLTGSSVPSSLLLTRQGAAPEPARAREDDETPEAGSALSGDTLVAGRTTSSGHS